MNKNCALNDALEKVHDEITKPAPQGLRHHRAEKNKVENLREAVIGNSWTRDACSRAAAGRITYREFCSQWEDAIQLEQEEKIRRVKDQKHIQVDPFAGLNTGANDSTSIFYNGQPKYTNWKQWNRHMNGPL